MAPLAPRQAGSTLKPFLYAMAIGEQRLTAASLLEDRAANLPAPRPTHQAPTRFWPHTRITCPLTPPDAGSHRYPMVSATSTG